jgi:hypothetical protein
MSVKYGLALFKAILIIRFPLYTNYIVVYMVFIFSYVELEISLVIRDVLCYLVLYKGRDSLLRGIQTKLIVYVLVSKPKHSN